MASLLRSLKASFSKQQQQPSSSPLIFVRHESIKAKRARDAMDPRIAIIRRILYPPNIRHTPSPTGAWRPNVLRMLSRAIPSRQGHETIERAFKLYNRHTRQKRQAELNRKYESMKSAVTELARIDIRLAREANKKDDPRMRTDEELQQLRSLHGTEKIVAEARIEGRIRGLFPRELRLPVDTPSKDGWNHDWKPAVAKVI
ncbi:hypothetical protein M422DRAFT_242567 [Sphaerobolus stellatus SS14]|nr:hypothetical protein M422DRAFT_242567 [Sphaerobolus stellatus SS14]